MGIVNLKNTVRAHLFRERFEVMLAVLIPFLFMIESGYACAWILVDGRLGWDMPSLLAFARGFAIEAFVFVCFKLVHIFVVKGSHDGKPPSRWRFLTPLFPLLIGVVGVIVSAGMNLGFMVQSPEMRTVMSAISGYMPLWLANTFRLGLGLLFPVGVALFALFDVRHLIDEVIASSHLDERADIIEKAQIWRANLAKMTKRAIKERQDHLKQIADADADRILQSVKSGDMSFGANAARTITSTPSSVTKVTPVGAPAMSHRPVALPPAGPGQPLALPPAGSAQGWSYPPVGPGQVLPAPGPTQPLLRW